MASKDNASCIQAKYTVGGGAHTSSVAAGTQVDTYGFESVTFYMLPESWTDGTHTPTYQHSDDGSSWSNCAASDFTDKWGMPAAISSSPTAVAQKSAYVGGKRYVRGNVAVTGATTGAKYAILVILSHAVKEPVAA